MVRVETNHSGPIRCRACCQTITNGNLQVVQRSTKFGIRVVHLSCWRPETTQPYKADWFFVMDVEARDKRGELVAWVNKWNSQFETKEEHVPAQYLTKSVMTTETPLKRLLLEVFQYLTVTDTETKVAYTCKAWFHVTRDEEFWRTRFMLEFNPSQTEQQGNYRRKFIAYRLGSCWHCKKLLSLPEISQRCPIFNQPLCKTCSRSSDCRLVSFTTFTDRCKATPATLKHLQIPYFLKLGSKVSYLLLFKTKMQAYAEARRRLLIQYIDLNHPELLTISLKNELQNFNFEAFYATEWERNCQLSKVEKELVQFCGLCGNRENVRKNVEMFVKQVQSVQRK